MAENRMMIAFVFHSQGIGNHGHSESVINKVWYYLKSVVHHCKSKNYSANCFAQSKLANFKLIQKEQQQQKKEFVERINVESLTSICYQNSLWSLGSENKK